MLTWLLCRLAPPLTPLTQASSPARPGPADETDAEARVRAVAAEIAELPFTPAGRCSPQRLLLGMGCLDLVTREADQHPDTAGRTPNYGPHPAFAPVEIPGADGVVLTGHHSVGPPGQPAVFVLHGLNDSHVSHYVVDHAEALRRLGFHVFALDLRDHGRLRGRSATTLGVAEGRDLFAAARTVSEREGVSVGIVGLSYGGHCAVRAAHEASVAGAPEVLRGGVIAVCAPLNMHEALVALDDPTHLPRGVTLFDRAITSGLLHMMRRHMKLRAAEHAPGGPRCDDHETFVRRFVMPHVPEAPPLVGAFLGQVRCARPAIMGSLAVPTLILHAEDDPLVPPLHARQAAAAAGGNPFVAVKVVPRGGHVALGYEDPAGYLAHLATWLGRLADG